eukprot:TRINITY_DN4219_c0_g1_i1.p1 TRINITY_DN4219_c0_g1~~TRINITY_DN4219_c0_g1_i1.p1  ORF type:complete len:149 (-),score=11.84 TRINITY_DN4219_c0_g1_i1:1544-1990(-)
MDIQRNEIDQDTNLSWAQKTKCSYCTASDFEKYKYNSSFSSKIKGLSIPVPKMNSDVKTTWSRCTLTMQALSYHFHSKAVEDIFHVNLDITQFQILQASYFPKQKTNIDYRHLSITILDSLIDVLPAFKQTLYTSPFYKYIHFYFESE